MRNLHIGVIGAGEASPPPLAAAALHQHGIVAQHLSPRPTTLEGIDAVVVDVPLQQRFEVISRLQDTFSGPILSQMPVASSAAECAALADRSPTSPLISLNPLCYDTSLARLVSDVHRSPERLQTLFASWRFKTGARGEQELAQMIDLVGVLAGSSPEHWSRMHRASPWLVLAIVNYADGLVASIEVGELLPESSTRNFEFVIECFDRGQAYHCQPHGQAVTVERDRTTYIPWRPDPFSAMLSEFISQVTAHDQKSTRGPLHDHTVLALCEALAVPS